MHVVTGLGPDGRSKVIEVRDLPVGGEIRSTETLWTTDEMPPSPALPRHPRDETWLDLGSVGVGVSPAGARWITSWLPSTRPARFHCTDTYDCDVIAFGEVTVILEDGEILLRAGDTLVLPGVVHAWKPGPEGCVITAFLLPIPPVS